MSVDSAIAAVHAAGMQVTALHQLGQRWYAGVTRPAAKLHDGTAQADAPGEALRAALAAAARAVEAEMLGDLLS